jgi:hypothetical protein
MAYARTKKLTDSNYSATIAASEEAIRSQVDGSIQEILDAVEANYASVAESKLSKTGNFTGTWNGVTMTSAEPGLSSAFNAHLAEIATVYINLAHYAPFNTLADGADITSIIQEAMDDVVAKIAGSVGWKIFKLSMFIPGGKWTVTKKRVFDLTSYILPAVRGFNIEGAGCDNTEITFDNNVADIDNYLIYNNNLWGFSEIKNIRFVSKNNTEKWMYMSAGDGGIMNAQSIRFDNVIIDGFKMGLYLDGTMGTSELDIYSCKFWNIPVGGHGIYCNNTQSVNHNLHSTDLEAILGTGIEYAKGGCLNVFGGSWIATGDAVLLKTSDSTGIGIGWGNGNFNFYGMRSELGDNAKLFDTKGYTHINYSDCNLATETSNPGASRGTVRDSNATVSFKGGICKYKFDIEVINGSSYLSPPYVTSDGTIGLSGASFLHNNVNNNSGYPVIDIKNSPTQYGEELKDVTINKGVSGKLVTFETKCVAFRNGYDYTQGLPGATPCTFKLPLGAIILKVRIIHKYTALYGATTHNYTVKNYDNTVTFVTATGVVNTFDGAITSNDLWYEIDTEAKRTINVAQTGDTHEAPGYILVEYI